MFSQTFALGNAQKLQVAGDFPLPAVLLLPSGRLRSFIFSVRDIGSRILQRMLG